jgi:F-type H+-transporting ATPase subunit delta
MGLLDIKMNRVRAGVTLVREPNAEIRKSIAAGLTQALKKDVIASFRVDPEILGGLVVRVGDRVYDGSVRRRMLRLRRQLVAR